MPNWCSNVLTVKGAKKELARFRKANKGSYKNEAGRTINNALQLNALVPMPPELENTQSPGNENSPEAKALKKKHGYSNWYDWRVANWGTKWEVSEENCTLETVDGALVYTFDTAWSPPGDWLDKVSKLFPSLEFSIRYSDEGGGFYGRTTGKDGEWDVEEFGEGEYYEKFDEAFQDKIAWIKKLPYGELVKTFTNPDSYYDGSADQPSHYTHLDKFILARIKPKDLPLFINRPWDDAVKAEYARLLKGE